MWPTGWFSWTAAKWWKKAGPWIYSTTPSTDARRLSSARFFRLQYNIYMWLKRYHAAAPGDGEGRPDKTPPVPRFDEETGAPSRGDEAGASNEPSLKPGPETAPIDLSGLDALGRRPIIDPNATQALDLNS